ncbi:glycosyltransferase [Aeromicrobium sp. SORGH_AS_0981]|uniref:glycosyltransferase n=1 Tax=Aeromicrobium sp. SORGH_AS_0981 TaxID=3041802 RepID=UPI00286A31DD|nr:glycosyltransferase [Aeromicrobium sp. SORGH_AS_0981]
MSLLLTHEWIAGAGGSENVFEQFVREFPDADQVCLWNDDEQRFPDARETWLGRTPLRRSKPLALAFERQAIRGVDLSGYDAVLSSSHAFGHYFATRAARAGRPAFAYVHSPARYIWSPEEDRRGQGRVVRTLAKPQRVLDRRTVSPKVSYAANSVFVRDRMLKSWGVGGEVIHPPIRVVEIGKTLSTELSPDDKRVLSELPSNFILGASRLVDYKRLDLVLRLAESLRCPAVIAGDGPARGDLEAYARKLDVDVHFLGRVSDRALYELFRRARLYVFLPVEDFGIMPLEAVAAGAPVLVNSRGGAWEGVARTQAGERCDPRDWDGVTRAALSAIERKGEAGLESVASFDDQEFRSAVRAWVGAR